MERLIAHGIRLPSYNPGEHKTLCPSCSHTRKNKSDKCLSVKIDTQDGAAWNCHNCGMKGNIAGGGNAKDNWNYRSRPHRREYTTPTLPEKREMKPGLSKWFADRCIDEYTMKDFEIHVGPYWFGPQEGNQNCICFPYYEDGELVNCKYRTVKKQFRQSKDAKRTLYNIDNVKKHWEVEGNPKEVIFVEGEMDVLSVYQAGHKNVCSLPDGGVQEVKFDPHDKRFEALQNCEWIIEAEKVIIAVDEDQVGDNLRQELIHRFGKDICWVVRWPKTGDVQLKDANEVLCMDSEAGVRDAIKSAEPFPIDGLYDVASYREDVMDIYFGRVQQPISTGYANLDEIYKVMPGTFCVITGTPGSGKSNLVDQIMVNLMRNENWRFVVFSPEHSTPNHLRRLVEKVVCKPFDSGPTERMTPDEVEEALEFLHEHITFIEHKETLPDIDWLIVRAKAACVRGVEGVLFDPYNEISTKREQGEREDMHISKLISKCKALCQKHHLQMWMIAHPQKMYRNKDGKTPVPTLYDISGAAHWYNKCDIGLTVDRDFDSGETTVICRKAREAGLWGQAGMECYFQYSVVDRTYHPIDKKKDDYNEAAEPSQTSWTEKYDNH